MWQSIGDYKQWILNKQKLFLPNHHFPSKCLNQFIINPINALSSCVMQNKIFCKNMLNLTFRSVCPAIDQHLWKMHKSPAVPHRDHILTILCNSQCKEIGTWWLGTRQRPFQTWQCFCTQNVCLCSNRSVWKRLILWSDLFWFVCIVYFCDNVWLLMSAVTSYCCVGYQ